MTTASNSTPGLAAGELDELCRILIGADRDLLIESIARLQERGHFVDWQAQTLADAMRLALARDPAFADSMSTMISKGVHTTVERDSDAFGRALAPAMGPAIRNAVRLMLQNFVQSIETVVDQQLSWRSVRWRIEAWRTKRTFAEIAFLHTLLFRVEHVFLVYRDSGVELLHATRPGAIAREPDLIAAMLTAIQDFVRDAFDAPSSEGATGFTVGDLNVVVENGSHAALAAVVRGQARTEIRLQLRESLDRIEQTMTHELVHFDGDTEAFDAVMPQVEACLMESRRSGEAPRKQHKGPRPTAWILIGTAVALLTWYVIAQVVASAHHQRLVDFVAKVRLEPGYVITDVDYQDDRVVLRGLRDPLARPFEQLTVQHSTTASATAQLQPYHALDVNFLAQRLNQLLAPPDGVELEVRDTELVLTGRASHEWLQRTRTIAMTIAGIETIDDSGCIDADEENWHAVATRLHAFDPPVAALADRTSGERREFSGLIRQLSAGAARLGRTWRLDAAFVWWTEDQTSDSARLARELVGDLSRELGLPVALIDYIGDATARTATLRLTATLLR